MLDRNRRPIQAQETPLKGRLASGYSMRRYASHFSGYEERCRGQFGLIHLLLTGA